MSALDPGGLVAVFGGAFNPVHFGHLKPAFELLQRAELERVVFVPCKLHPHKGRIGNDRIDDEHRLAMLRMVVGPPSMSVDTREIRAHKTSYTVNTLGAFRKQLGDAAPLAFMLGEDAFADVCGWHDHRRLLELAHLIVTRRAGFSGDDKHPLLKASGGYVPLQELARLPAGKVCRFDNTPVSVSSTRVRQLLERGEQPRYLLPGAIWSYIRRNRLYSCQ